MTSIFVNEDLSKPENRINLAIFSLMMYEPFRRFMQRKLRLPDNSVLYPPTNSANDAGGGRPDFEIKAADTDTTLAWIEVELMTANEAQFSRYRAMLGGLPLLTIYGRAGSGADLSLEEIASFARSHSGEPHPQLRFNLAHLAKLIDEGLAGRHGIALPTAPVSAHVRELPFVTGLVSRLGAVNFEIGTPMRPGEIRANTRGADGFSLRVYTRVATEKSVSVLNITGGRPEVYFQSAAKMNRYLPTKGDSTERLSAFVHGLGGDMKSISVNGKTSVPIDRMDGAALDELANIVKGLAA